MLHPSTTVHFAFRRLGSFDTQPASTASAINTSFVPRISNLQASLVAYVRVLESGDPLELNVQRRGT